MRIDKFLVEKNFYKTRSSAQNNIKLGNVYVNNKKIDNAHYDVLETDVIKINDEQNYVSRGAYKLLEAIKQFNISLKDKVVLDIGSSTGGFTQVAIAANAKHVYSVDVGTDQMDQVLRTNSKITLYEQTHFNDLNEYFFKEKIDYIVADLSFISLTKLLDKIVTLFDYKYKCIFLIKPQFELSKEEIDKAKGKVKEEKLWTKAKNKIVNYAQKLQFKNFKLCDSPILGNKGKNKEFLIYMEK